MNRREVMGTMGAAGMATLFAGNAIAQQQSNDAADVRKDHFDDCADACADCQIECHRCSEHCVTLLAQGHKQHFDNVKICADCGDLCAASANIMARRGVLSATVCGSCIEACEQCAKACERFSDDRMMKACAAECRECAKACREMLKHLAEHAAAK
jgi:hypothetical protein